MKITSVQSGRVAAGRHDKRVVTVRVKLAQAEESMRITVVVPEEADEEAAWEYGIARAKDAARQFSTCSEDLGIKLHLAGRARGCKARFLEICNLYRAGTSLTPGTKPAPRVIFLMQ
jgi:hypothetical protein